MNDSPFFSVIVATYNRGRHILPTLRSALAQTETDFEIHVIGDGCTDDTGDVVQSLGAPKVFWSNLAKNGGSQSFANNAGIRAARGKWIAYLGHDDIWTRDHLAALRRVIEETKGVDFAVSGCVYWGPLGSGFNVVSGVFDDSEHARIHFLPPSSFAHRREIIEQIGEWASPETVALPVDSEFELRALNKGLQFFSTKQITVHKFAAGNRYLSYLQQSSEEQEALCAALEQGAMPGSKEIIDASRQRKQFSLLRHPEPRPSGEYFELGRRNKGLSLPPLRTLAGCVAIEAEADSRAIDWYSSHDGNRHYLTSWMNPRPKLLIPVTGGEAEIEIELRKAPEAILQNGIPVLVGGKETRARIIEAETGGLKLALRARLKRDDYTVLQLLLAPKAVSLAPSLAENTYEPIVIGTIWVKPVSLWESFRARIRSLLGN